MMPLLRKIGVLPLMVAAVIFTAGCADNIMTLASRPKKVDTTDGVNIQEARMIARAALKESSEASDYRANSGVVIDNFMSKAYPGYWFVGFANKRFDQSFWEYLVVVEKEAGDVYFSGAYVPLEVFSYDWVFKKDLPVNEEEEVIYRKHIVTEKTEASY